MIYNMSCYEKVDFLSFCDVRASKWTQNDPQAQKQLQILKAHTFTFPMTYSKSIYENKLGLSCAKLSKLKLAVLRCSKL